MNIKDNYEKIIGNIAKACQRVGREPSEITVMGVAKGQPSEKVQEAYQCGINLIGENKTQEAEIHQTELNDLDIKWHFIGKLQKNKINRILKGFDFIQSVDGVKSLEHIHKRVNETIEVFIEINIGDEKNKSGFTVDGLKKALNYIAMLDRVKITGMMTIPPYSDDPEDVRPFFRKVRELKEEINDMKLSNFDIKHLSMGMSSDYEVAVEEGATIVRVGTALFGETVKVIAAHFVRAIAQLLHMVIYLYSLIIIARSVISWVGTIPPNALIYTLRRLTDPVFRWVHKNLPFTVVGGIDISPIFILITLYFIDNLLYHFLMDISLQMVGK